MAGLGAFIQGAFSGYEYGENVKDRKTSRERAKTRYEWEQEDREYTTQRREEEDEWRQYDRGYVEDQRSRKTKEQDRIEADRREERSVLEAAGAAAQDSFGQTQQQPETTSTPPQMMPPSEGQPPAAPAQTQGGGQPAAPQRPPQPGRGVLPQVGGMAQSPQQGAPRTDMAVRLNAPPEVLQEARTADGIEAALTTGIYPNSDGRPLTDQDRQMFTQILNETNQRLEQWMMANRPAENTVGNWLSGVPQGEPPRTPEPNPRVQAANATQGAGSVAASRGVMQSAMNVPPAQPPAQPMRNPGSTPAQRQAPAQPGAPAAGAPPQADVETMDRVARENPPDQGGSPSVESAAATAPTQGRGVFGKDDPIKTTPKAREQAVGNFIDHYAETQVPKIVQYYLSKGQIEKAEAFEAWANGRESKATMKAWAQATHSAAIGDEEGFLDGMAATYNSFDDGYEAVRDQSGFIKDRDGNISGARISLRNKETGEVFEQVFDNQQDIIRQGIYAMSPEQIFEQMWGQVEAAQRIEEGEREHQRKIELEQVKAGMKGEGDNARDIALAKKALAEGMMTGWDQLSPEVQDQMALDYVRRNRSLGRELSLPSVPPPYTGE